MTGARHAGTRWSAAARAVALALALAPGGARAEGTARADLAVAAQESSEDASSLYRRQSYQLAFDQAFSDALRYELRLEFFEDRGVTSSAGLDGTELHAWSLRPVGSVAWVGEDTRAALTYNRAYRESLDPLTERMRGRWIDALTASAQYAPTLTFHANAGFTRDGVSDPARGTDAVRNAATLAVDWTRGPFRVAELNRLSEGVDRGRGTRRLTYGPALELVYAQAFGDRATLSTRYALDYQRAEDSATGSTGSTALVEVRAAAGLYAVDDYPIDSTAPMSRVAALVDGDVGVSAGISLGPDGASFQNLGIDAGRALAADEIWVDVRDGAGDAVLSGGQVSWSVYASDDGLRWLAVAPGAGAFDPSRSLYRVTFAPTVARYFKVVNFGTNTLDTWVTEVEVFHNEPLLARRTRSSSTLAQALQAGVTVTPVQKLVLGFQGSVTATASESDDVAAVWALEGTQAYTSTAGPFRNVWLDAAHTRLNVGRVGGRGASATQTTSGGARWRPLPTYDTDLLGAYTDDENPDARAHTFSVSHGHRLRPYPWLQVTLGASATAQRLESRSSPDRSTARYFGASALVDLRPTGTTELRADASAQRQLTREETGSTETLPISHVVPTARYGVEATWHPSPQLGLGGRWGHLSYADRSGWTQRYRVDWQPLPAGALQLSGSFDTEIDPLTGQSLRRVNASPRLKLNRWTQLGATYSYVRRSTDDGTTWDQYVYATFTLRL